MHTQVEKDLKKWILFNNQLSDFQKLYDLYTAVESKKSYGSVSLQIEEESDEEFSNTSFIIEQTACSTSLQIADEGERKEFLTYLSQNYIPGEGIEEWYHAKLQEREKRDNLYVAPSRADQEDFNFQVHPKENTYYQLRLFFSGFIYLTILIYIIGAFLNSTASGFIALASILAVVLIFALLKRISMGFFIGLVKGNAVKLNEEQYPEVYAIVAEQSNILGLSEVPSVYVTYGHFNAFVTKFARKKFLVLYSEVLETAAKGNMDVLKFVIAHELGHLKRKHLNKEAFLAPSSFIPFLRLAHSRGAEYTCDRIGYHFSAQGAVEGIMIMAAGKEIYAKMNTQRFMEDAQADKSFWVWASEKFLSHPHVYKRMIAIKEYAETAY